MTLGFVRRVNREQVKQKVIEIGLTNPNEESITRTVAKRERR